MILIEAAAEAIGFFLKGIAVILLTAAAGLVFIILREKVKIQNWDGREVFFAGSETVEA